MDLESDGGAQVSGKLLVGHLRVIGRACAFVCEGGRAGACTCVHAHVRFCRGVQARGCGRALPYCCEYEHDIASISSPFNPQPRKMSIS